MTAFGVQGQLLDINILGCRNLRDTEWLSRQDPYVVITYASTKYRTKTDTDGGRNPSFNQKFVLQLIEGLREVTVEVWNSNTLTFDDFIGSGRIMLEKALSTGYDDSTWNLTSRRGKYAGEVRVILHMNKAGAPVASAYTNQPTAVYPNQPAYSTPPAPHAYSYGPPPPTPPYNAYPSPSPSPSSYYSPQSQRPEYAAPYPGSPYQPSGNPYQYPAPPAAGGYGPPYVPPPPAGAPARPPAGYPPVYQEYPYRPY